MEQTKWLEKINYKFKNNVKVVNALSGSKNNPGIENSTGNFFCILKENIIPIGPKHKKRLTSSDHYKNLTCWCQN